MKSELANFVRAEETVRVSGSARENAVRRCGNSWQNGRKYPS